MRHRFAIAVNIDETRCIFTEPLRQDRARLFERIAVFFDQIKLRAVARRQNDTFARDTVGAKARQARQRFRWPEDELLPHLDRCATEVHAGDDQRHAATFSGREPLSTTSQKSLPTRSDAARFHAPVSAARSLVRISCSTASARSYRASNRAARLSRIRAAA